MKTSSEFDIIKLLVANPIKLDKSFSKLNLRFIKDSTETENPLESIAQEGPDEANIEVTSRKITKLAYAVWSGLSKYLRSMV